MQATKWFSEGNSHLRVSLRRSDEGHAALLQRILDWGLRWHPRVIPSDRTVSMPSLVGE